MVGQTIAHYEVVEPLGAGGMGEVYRARDHKLERDVAIKVLPEDLADDADRLARLEREAKLLAALNHPNIATVHALEEHGRARFLVLELVDGQSLEQMLERGPLPVTTALDICRQVAEALEAAHEAGIIHRDLKPGNVLVRPDGRAKVLDFGIAESMQVAADVAQTAKATNLTVAGTLVGTPAYMSPEQVRGEPLDKRSDIWAFGCLLYELLAGKGAFARETLADTLSAIVDHEPEWSALPRNTPEGVRHLIERCLRKQPRRRLRDMGDAWVELEDVADSSSAAAHAVSDSGSWRRALPWAVATIGVAVGLFAILWPATRPAPSASIGRTAFDLPLPDGVVLDNYDASGSVAMSPDGSLIAFSAWSEGRPRLFLRHMDGWGAESVAGTEGARNPFFSPDGQWIGFFASGELKKVSTTGGAPQVLTEVSGAARGGTWAGNEIIFAPASKQGLMRVSEDGGHPQVLTTPAVENDETGHYWPHALPGGNALLFTSQTAETTSSDDRQIFVLSLESGDRKLLLSGGNNPVYAPSGHLVYSRAGALRAVAFDVGRLEVIEPSVEVLDNLLTTRNNGSPQFAIARNGSLVFVPGGAEPTRELVWVDLEGNDEPASKHLRDYFEVQVSPDGTRVAVVIGAVNHHLWILDLSRDTLRPLTDRWDQHNARWSPDGDTVFFDDDRTGPQTIRSVPADGGPVTTWVEGRMRAVSPDGNTIAFYRGSPGLEDIWMLPLTEELRPREFLATRYDERPWGFSPDGQWMLFTSALSGAPQVHMVRLSDASDQVQLSVEGAGFPLWAPSSRRVFYSRGRAIASVDFETEPELSVGPPVQLFEYDDGYVSWNIAPAGDRFLMVRRVGANLAPSTHVNVVLNWVGDLDRLVAERARR